jgi:Ca2+-binding EF-hand superfamily protein
MLHAIREEFRQCARSNKEYVTAGELCTYWQQLTEEESQKNGNGLLSAQEKTVIKLRVSQMMQDMDIKKTGRISMEEWVHYMLLTQSKQAAVQINSLLKNALSQQPQILKDLQLMFEAADTMDNGRLTFKAIMEMYSRKLWHLRPGNDGRPLTGKELEAGDADKFAREIIEEMDLDGDAEISYAEFMAYCVGRRKQEVTMHLYDISNGMASKASPYVLSMEQQVEGVYHSGVVVFGKEYFFSRDTVFDEAGGTAFGKPKKVLRLGYTLWRQSELHKYIVDVLKPRFHRDTYDVIDCNCNHFSDAVSMYLLGKHLPEEVYIQPKIWKSLAPVRWAQPLMTWWLKDGVVRRGNEKDVVAIEEKRPKIDKPLRMGTVVRIYPADSDTPSAPSVLGLVVQMDGQTITQPVQTFLHGQQGEKTPRWDLCGCSYVVPANHPHDKALCQFFDLTFDPAAGSCKGIVRTELVPHTRLAVEKMDELTI